jgi:4-amino-4-deoxy-L-arabinose transferase-like glycosyltransferase
LNRRWALIIACGTALWLVNAVWLTLDTRPPVWDMALHQAYALHYVPGFPAPGGMSIWQWSGNYPPLVHVLIAIAFSVFHPGPDVAALANLPATFLLLWSLFELGCYIATPAAAQWTCVLMLLTPYLMWMSRETILDYWLSAWVVCAWAILVRTDGFESSSWSRLFGLVCAAGLLTKWLFAGFVAAPLLLVALRHRIWKDKRRLWHATQALILAGAVAGIWYAPNIPRLIPYFSDNAQIGALEGEPPVLSFQSFIYYLRLLEGYQLYGLLFAVLAVGLVFVFSRRLFRAPAFWTVCIAGGWLAMTLLRTKDPRFTMPLLGPLLLAPGACLAEWGRTSSGRVVRAVVVAALVFQAYAINFGIAWLPQEVVLMRGYQGSLRWDWQLFAQNYFGILGAPRPEDWKQSEIIDRVVQESRLRGSGMALALVPDLPRFNTSNFLLAAAEAKIPMQFNHVRSATAGVAAFEGLDFAILSDGEQGMSWTTHAAEALNHFIADHPVIFRPIASFSLPNKETAHLYFIDHGAAPAR